MEFFYKSYINEYGQEYLIFGRDLNYRCEVLYKYRRIFSFKIKLKKPVKN